MTVGPVVVIDDEPDLLKSVGDLLEDDGYPALCFSRPCGTDSIAAQHHPVAFLVDLVLPGTNGIDLARTLRTVFVGTPMVAMSASPEMLCQARSSGLFQATIPKPFDLVDLLDTIEHCIL